MARTELTVEPVVRAGLAATYTAAFVDGHKFKNDGKTILHIKNGAVALNLTVQTPGTVDGLAVADRVVAVGASTDKFIGPFPASQYNQAADGMVYIDYDDLSNVTVAVLRV